MSDHRFKIIMKRDGGFAGIGRSVALDTSKMPPEAARELEGLVRDSNFFELPARPSRIAGGTDRFQYRITVSGGGKRHGVRLNEADVPDQVRPLLDRLSKILQASGVWDGADDGSKSLLRTRDRANTTVGAKAESASSAKTKRPSTPKKKRGVPKSESGD